MIDLNPRKVPVFANINDVPSEPTATQAGNGSDLIFRYNSLIDDIAGALGGSSIYQILESNMEWFVSPDGDDNATGGVQAPFATLQKATEVAASYINRGSYTRSIFLLPGIYNGAKLTGFFNRSTEDYIKIEGAGNSNSDVIIQGYDCISMTSPGIYFLKGMTLRGSQEDGNCLCINGARIKLGSLDFSTAQRHIVGWNHATIEILEDYKIVNGAVRAHIALDSYAFLDTTCAMPGRGITLENDPYFSNFANLGRNSYLSAVQTSFTGTGRGGKFYADGNSVINTGTSDPNHFPGDSSGTLLNNSQYF